MLAVWSATPEPRFTTRLNRAGFRTEVHTVRARPGKGAHHTIWLAHAPGGKMVTTAGKSGEGRRNSQR